MSTKTTIYIHNTSNHTYKIKDVLVKPHSDSVVELHYSSKDNIKYYLKGKNHLSFKINKNGNLNDLSKYLNYGCNTVYFPRDRSLGTGLGTIWEEDVVAPSFYQRTRHLVITEH